MAGEPEIGMPSFSGAKTRWVHVKKAGSLNNAVQNQILNTSRQEATEVSRKIIALRGKAEEYAATAYSAIWDCMRFEARVPSVSYVAPQQHTPHLITGQGDAKAPFEIDEFKPAEFSRFTPATTTAKPFSPSPDVAEPTLSDPTFSDPPTISAGNMIAPTAPQMQATKTKDAPQIEIQSPTMPHVPAPDSPPDIALQNITFGDVLPMPDLPPPIDIAALDEAIARLHSAMARQVHLPKYNPVIADHVMGAVGRLLADDLAIDAQKVLSPVVARQQESTQEHDDMLSGLWANRGMSAASDVVLPQYQQAMQDRDKAWVARDNATALALWRDDELASAYRAGVTAHSAMIDIELRLYDMEFDALLLRAEAELERAKAMASVYNGVRYILEAKAEQAFAEYARIEGKARRYRANAALAQEQGRINEAVADAFSAGERAKQIDADLFSAKVGINDARVRAFRAKMDALAAQAKALNVEGEQYKAAVLTWEAEVEQANAQYKQASGRARVVMARNQAEAAKAGFSGVKNEMVSAQARKIAAEVSGELAGIRARVQARAAQYANVEGVNAVESMKPQIADSKYDAQVAQWGARFDEKISIMEGRAAEYKTAASFFNQSYRMNSRARELSMQANQQLVKAYLHAEEAGSAAAAAVESGRLAGYRANANLQASAGFRSTTSTGRTGSESYLTSVSESDNETIHSLVDKE